MEPFSEISGGDLLGDPGDILDCLSRFSRDQHPAADAEKQEDGDGYDNIFQEISGDLIDPPGIGTDLNKNLSFQGRKREVRFPDQETALGFHPGGIILNPLFPGRESDMEGIFRLVDLLPPGSRHPEVNGEVFPLARVLIKEHATVKKTVAGQRLVVNLIYPLIGLIRNLITGLFYHILVVNLIYQLIGLVRKHVAHLLLKIVIEPVIEERTLEQGQKKENGGVKNRYLDIEPLEKANLLL